MRYLTAIHDINQARHDAWVLSGFIRYPSCSVREAAVRDIYARYPFIDSNTHTPGYALLLINTYGDNLFMELSKGTNPDRISTDLKTSKSLNPWSI